MTTKDFSQGDRVKYVPLHAGGDESHKDCETGTVSSTNAKFVFVKFDQHVIKFGLGGATAQACDPNDLVRAA